MDLLKHFNLQPKTTFQLQDFVSLDSSCWCFHHKFTEMAVGKPIYQPGRLGSKPISWTHKRNSRRKSQQLYLLGGVMVFFKRVSKAHLLKRESICQEVSTELRNHPHLWYLQQCDKKTHQNTQIYVCICEYAYCMMIHYHNKTVIDEWWEYLKQNRHSGQLKR